MYVRGITLLDPKLNYPEHSFPVRRMGNITLLHYLLPPPLSHPFISNIHPQTSLSNTINSFTTPQSSL